MTETPQAPGTPADTPDPAAQLAPTDAAATTTAGGSAGFDITFDGTDYHIKLFTPDPATQQYGFSITTQSATATSPTTVASLTYKDQDNWEIKAGLPSALKVDTNLTVNVLTFNIVKGVITEVT